MRVEVTSHAVERFVKRFVPEMTLLEARTYLETFAPAAGRMKEKTIRGQEQWRLETPRCLLVVKRDPDGTIAIVTVLPEPEPVAIDEDEETFEP